MGKVFDKLFKKVNREDKDYWLYETEVEIFFEPKLVKNKEDFAKRLENIQEYFEKLIGNNCIKEDCIKCSDDPRKYGWSYMYKCNLGDLDDFTAGRLYESLSSNKGVKKVFIRQPLCRGKK